MARLKLDEFPVPPLGMATENDDFLPAAHVKVGRGPGADKNENQAFACGPVCAGSNGMCVGRRAPSTRLVSTGHDGVASVAPSVTGTGRGTIATNSSRYKDHRYFVEFRSRYALSYRHTYVAFGRVNEAKRAVNLEVAGLHPASTSEFLMSLVILCRCPPKPERATVTWKNNTDRVGA